MSALLILYGSEKGNANSISGRIHQDALEKGFKSTWQCLSEYIKTPLPQGIPIIVVASSTGQGEPPANAEGFWRAVRRKKGADDLAGVKYAVLGLGDSNYDTYQGFPKALIKKFGELGAQQFYETGFADDGTGLEDVVEPWIVGLWKALSGAAPEATPQTQLQEDTKQDTTAAPPAVGADQKVSVVLTGETTESGKAKRKFVRKVAADPTKIDGVVNLPRPISELVLLPDTETVNHNTELRASVVFNATVSKSHYLTAPDALKQVLHMELDVKDKIEPFTAGDAFGVVPHNASTLVDALIVRLGLTPDQKFLLKPLAEQTAGLIPKHFQSACTVKQAFTEYCDLTSPPRKVLLRVLAEHTNDETQKQDLLKYCSTKDTSAYDSVMHSGVPSLLELLTHFPSSQPPLNTLLENLLPIPIRWYSVCNSPLLYPQQIHFALTVVKVPIEVAPFTKTLEGVCSNWIRNQLEDHKYIQTEQNETSVPLNFSVLGRSTELNNFHLPSDSSIPIIMIGPGTGVAPFRGFCQEREYRRETEKKTLGPAWLFFGCRNQSDCLYQQELTNFEEKKVIDNLVIAFSRETENVIYVQHKLKEHSEALVQLMLKENAICYLCGDGNKMAHDVKLCWLDMLQQHVPCDLSTADQILKEWIANGRYKLDVWTA